MGLGPWGEREAFGGSCPHVVELTYVGRPNRRIGNPSGTPWLATSRKGKGKTELGNWSLCDQIPISGEARKERWDCLLYLPCRRPPPLYKEGRGCPLAERCSSPWPPLTCTVTREELHHSLHHAVVLLESHRPLPLACWIKKEETTWSWTCGYQGGAVISALRLISSKVPLHQQRSRDRNALWSTRELCRLQYLHVHTYELEMIKLHAPNLTKFEFDNCVKQVTLSESLKLSKAMMRTSLVLCHLCLMMILLLKINPMIYALDQLHEHVPSY